MDIQLGHVGIWWSGRWPKDQRELAELLGRLHALGYETVWRSGGFEKGLSPEFGRMLGANRSIKVASGIHSIWTTPAEDTAKAVAELEEAHPGRFLLGLGVSHAPVVEASGQHYERPCQKMEAYLDRLDAAETPVAPQRRVVAALGPRMLRLAASRAAGAHPYFVPLEHTESARAVLGEGPLLAPEVAVVLEEDAGRARAMARSYMQTYLALPNYTENLRRLGYGEDLAEGGSDRLVDAVVAWGDEAAVAARVRAHLEAGADHVCLQVLNGGYGAFPLAEHEVLAPALFPL